MMSGGYQKNPLLKSSYSGKLDTKNSLLSTSTVIVSKKPKPQGEKGHVTGDRFTRQLSDKPKIISTPSIKLVGTTTKLSEKYAAKINLNEKSTNEGPPQASTHLKTETLSKSAKPIALRSSNLQTKSLLLSATKSGLLTTKKPTTSPLSSTHLKSSTRSSHLSTTSSKETGKFSTRLLSSSYSSPSAVTSLKTTRLKTQTVGKTSRPLAKSGLEASTVQKHNYRHGAAGRDDTDDGAAPHYDLKLETARSDVEDEVEMFLPPELDPSIHEPVLATISVVQV